MFGKDCHIRWPTQWSRSLEQASTTYSGLDHSRCPHETLSWLVPNIDLRAPGNHLRSPLTMDRNSCLWPGSENISAAIDSLPARSSSAPPNGPRSLITADEAGSTAATDRADSPNATYTPATGWNELHITYDVITAPPAADERSLFPSLVSDDGHHPHLSGTQSATVLQAMTSK